MLEVALFVSLFAAKTADLPPGAVLRLGDARWRAGGEIARLWFSADGKTLSAEVMLSGYRITWDAATGVRLAAAGGNPPDGDAESVRLKDGRVLFTTGRAIRDVTDGPAFTAKVRDEAGRRKATLGRHTGIVTAVAASADETQFATGDSAGLVRIWDAATLRPLNHPVGHIAPIDHVELSPDGKRLLTVAEDRTLRVWDMTTGKELRAITDLPLLYSGDLAGRPQRPTFTPDGLAVVFSTKDRLVARDVLTGLEVPLHGGLAKQPPSWVGFAPDGKAAWTLLADGFVFEVWDWPTGKKRYRIEASDGFVLPGLSPDGTVVFANVESPERWDAKTGERLAPGPGPVRFTQALWRNPRLVILFPAGDRPRVVEPGTGRAVPGFHVPGDSDTRSLLSRRPWLSPTGRQFATQLAEAEISVFETATATVRRRLSCPDGHRILGFTPDGTRLLTAGADHTVLVWDVRPQSMPLPEAVRGETNAAKLWATMCAGKADAAYLAMARLAAEPDAAVKTARLRMKPAAAPTAATLDRILRDLADAEFAVREAAERELDAHGEPAALLVRERLAKLASAEARRRAEGFVGRWTGDGLAGVRLADARAVELLESLGTTEAREFLKELAAGEASAERTREAKRALERVGADVKR